ncbi:dienelactone hydrolase family protein [Pseudonocardia eucalypti]|uniref:Dienelactone hydrolase family protein n=1 Tax=Pseudonocardia eucalypti TaxID=648755 RepID=A0ABP9R8R0_9PSEU|nr:dienelactone hydrolase [Pseudonocardia eucalypti]
MVTARDIEYRVNGSTMRGRLALPDGTGQRPGVLIAHEGNGLDEFQRTRPERLAELGYVAFALDYHGDGRVFTDSAQMLARVEVLGNDLDLVRTLGQAGLDVLTAEPRTDPTRLAAIGYCFGGTTVLELARSGADLKAVVGFHPGLLPSRPADSPNIRGKVLMCIGANDPIVPMAQRVAFEEDMRAAGVDWRMNLYGRAEHSFTHPRTPAPGTLPGVRYHQPSDERSWRAMIDLFDEVFGAG